LILAKVVAPLFRIKNRAGIKKPDRNQIMPAQNWSSQFVGLLQELEIDDLSFRWSLTTSNYAATC
jgi:hypothetical protein